jgi:hypothetical protein
MAAQKRVQDSSIREALECWRGNIQAAAAWVGLAPNNFRRRLKELALDPAALRGEPAAGAPPDHYIPDGPRQAAPFPPIDQQQSEGDISPAAGHAPNPVGMGAALPVVPRQRERPIRILPEYGDRIRRGRRRLAAETDNDLDDSALLGRFIEERFAIWVEELVRQVRESRGEGTGDKNEGGK